MHPTNTMKVFKKIGIKPVKHRGQNFLISEIFLKKIIASADIKPGETVLEIGSGTGNLTLELLSVGAQVIAVEKDPNLIKILKLQATSYKLQAITADILEFDETTIHQPYKVVANIPYYLTGQIIQKFLLSPNKPTKIILMVQKEVGERICAQIPKANYLSSLVQFLAEAEVLFKVAKENFWPKPKVDSVIIKITPRSYAHNFKPDDFTPLENCRNKTAMLNNHEQPRQQSKTGDPDIFLTGFINFLRLTFKQPRKTLFNNLKRDKFLAVEEIEKIFNEFNWPKNIRPQNLTIAQLQNLFTRLNAKETKLPVENSMAKKLN